MGKLTKQEVFESIEVIEIFQTINAINNGDYENSIQDFFEELDKRTLNVSQEEKEIIITFIKKEVSSWNNTSYEYQEYGNFLYRNIITNGNETIIKIYETNAEDEIRIITTLTLLV